MRVPTRVSPAISELIENHGGMLPWYAFPGGYVIAYVDSGNNFLCPKDASENDDYTEDLEDYFVLEGEELYCDHCSTAIHEL